MTRIYKIMGAQEWAAMQASGAYPGSAKDIEDGYIHLSSAAQAGETARLHFRGRPDLVLLEFDAEHFGADLVWEPSRGGQLFPHLYGALRALAVRAVHAAPLGDDETPVVPKLQP
jgi:uncharacterized protein (DUF952 family)